MIKKLLEEYYLYKLRRTRRNIIRTYDKDRVYLNIGAGLFLKKNWRILDYCPYHAKYVFPPNLLEHNLDLTNYNTLPIEDNSVDLVYSSHCMEHIGDANALKTFREIYRILKPGGVFRISVPDIDLSYDAFKRNDHSFFQKINNQGDKSSILSCFLDAFTTLKIADIDQEMFLNDFKLLSKEDFLNKYTPKNIDFSTHNYSRHICWFNYDKLKKLGETIGFKKSVRSLPNESEVEEMRSGEFDKTQKYTSVYVEYSK